MRIHLLTAALLPLLIAAPAIGADKPDPQSEGDDEGGTDIVVTAQRLDQARDSIQPSLGASIYTLDRTALDIQPGGADRGLKGVLLQAPGVTQDSDNDGDVHIRNEHGNIQYRLNGVTLPDSFASFGAPVDQRIATSIAVITGALPAQYGLHTAGIVDIKTMTGKFDLDGNAGIYGGGNGLVQPSASLRNASGNLNYFVAGSYLRSNLGIAAPTPEREVLHDRTEQWRGFGYASYILDDSSRLTAFGSAAVGSFQIPNVPGQSPQFTLNGQSTFDSATLDQNQHNQTHFGALAYQYSGSGIDLQIAPFIRFARVHYTPDPRGGLLLFDGADSDLVQRSLAWGVQADASAKLGQRHTLRLGTYFQRDYTTSDSINRVFLADADGNQTSDAPLSIPVNQALTGTIWSAYLQDEWKLSEALTFNFGLRYDHVSAQVSEGQLSPRASLVWKPSETTTLHAGYARYFTPPPLQLVAASSLAAFSGTTSASPTLLADPIRAERQHSFDVGVQQKVGHLTLGIDAYLKLTRNLLDEEAFGGTEIQSPFNYAKARTWGVEFTANYEHGPVEAYLNVARGQQKATQIISNQFFFVPDELAAIASQWIYTDHVQKLTISGGGALKLHDPLGKLTPSFDFIYGSGLRKADPAGLVPNGGTVDPYLQVNLGIAQVIGEDEEKSFTIRFDVTNLLDRTYLIRDGSGVGAGAPQYGPRRAFFVGINRSF